MAKSVKQMVMKDAKEDDGLVAGTNPMEMSPTEAAEQTPQLPDRGVKAPRPNMTDFEYNMWLATRNHMGGRAADVKGDAVTYVISW